MSLLPLALIALSAAPPRVALVQRQTLGASRAQLRAVLEGLASALARQGVEVVSDEVPCGEPTACLAQRAAASESTVAVGVTVVLTRKGLSVDVEARTAQGKSVSVRTFDVPLAGTPLPADADELVAAVVRAVVTPESDAPRAVALVPPVERAPTPEAEALAQARHLRARAFGTAGVAVGGAALVCAALGAGLALSLESTLGAGRVTPGTRSGAQTQAGLANGLLNVGIAAAFVGAGLGATAFALSRADARDEDEAETGADVAFPVLARRGARSARP